MTGLQVDGTARHHARGQDLGLMCLVGTFAYHTVCHEASVVKVEDDVPLDKACLISCGVTTGWGSAVHSAKVAPGDAVVVVGVGGVGTAAVQGAVLAGARFVVAVDPSEFKRESAIRFGATHAASSIEEALGLVRDITWGHMADKVVLAPSVVHGDMIAPLMALVAKGGRAVVTGVTPVLEMDVLMNLADLTLSQKELVGSLFGGANPREDIPRLLDLYRAGKLQLDEMVTQTYSLDDVNQGYQDLRENKNIRGVLLYD
jgi:S-(hydroxymethyl)glutathione dehydrogenase/alcohol dehydrogenase